MVYCRCRLLPWFSSSLDYHPLTPWMADTVLLFQQCPVYKFSPQLLAGIRLISVRGSSRADFWKGQSFLFCSKTPSPSIFLTSSSLSIWLLSHLMSHIDPSAALFPPWATTLGLPLLSFVLLFLCPYPRDALVNVLAFAPTVIKSFHAVSPILSAHSALFPVLPANLTDPPPLLFRSLYHLKGPGLYPRLVWTLPDSPKPWSGQ